MASVASQLIEEVTAHARKVSIENAREICADGTYFPNNLRKWWKTWHCVPSTIRPITASVLGDKSWGQVGVTSPLCAQFLPCTHNTTCLTKIMTTILNVILNNTVHALAVAGSYADTQSCANSSTVFVSLIIILPPDECQNSADERHQEPSVILSLIISLTQLLSPLRMD